jgi:hypothetical protein
MQASIKELYMKRNLLASLLLLPWALLLGVSNSFAQSAPPAIFYTDLESGPNTGGENNNGAIVTLYGKRFGATQGASTVTVGGGAVAAYKAWSDTKISVALGSAAQTGNIVVTVGSQASNGVPFTVRSGKIYCVSTSGNDNNSGSFPNSCWAGLYKAANTVAAGDIAYILNGVTLTGVNYYNADLWLGDSGSGTAGNPKALVVYPGATVTVGTPTDQCYGIRGSNYHGANDFWLIAGFTARATCTAIDTTALNGWKVVANDMACPNGSGLSACFHTDTTINMKFYGNYVHDVGTTAGAIDKFYHAVYFTTNSNHIDVGWNTVVPNPTHSTTSGGCRAIQFYSTGGSDQFDLHVHDNVIHDAICDGINFATVNADAGPVEAYNNVVYHVGTGPQPGDGASNYACVNTASSSSRTNAVQIYNNTMYDCGAQATVDSGGLSMSVNTAMTNNIISVVSGETYLTQVGGTNLSGSNNLWFGAGTAPSQTTANLTTVPLLVNPSIADFHLQATSPAIDAGKMLTLSIDIEGIKRPQGAGIDIGAYEYFKGGSTVQQPNPPTNLSVIVH